MNSNDKITSKGTQLIQKTDKNEIQMERIIRMNRIINKLVKDLKYDSNINDHLIDIDFES